MKNFMLLFIIISFVKCNSQNISLIGNWAIIEKNGEYEEFYIDDKSINVIATTGAQANMFSYQFDGKVLSFPYFQYNVTKVDDCNIIWYNDKDTAYLERILIGNNFNIIKQGTSAFMLRKYNYLVTHNYISSDSAINRLIDFKNLYQNRDTNIPEFEIINKDGVIMFKPIIKK